MPRKSKNTKKTRKTPRANKMPLKVGISTRPDYTVEFVNPQGFFIENDSTIETKGYILFDLNNCVGAGQYVDIFDYYRINWVEVTFRPLMTTVINRPYDDTTTPNSAGSCPNFICALDRDSNTSPGSFLQLKERAPYKMNKMTRKQVWKFTPNRLTMIYKTATTTGYKIDSDTKSFLDCAQSDIPHYGLKYACETSSPTRAFIYEVQIKYNVSFKGKRG